MSVSLAHANSEWEVKKDKNGVLVENRDMEGSQLKEFRVSAVLPFPVTDIVAVIRGVDQFEDWMPMFHSAEMISRSTEIQQQYIQSKAPWPVSNRDFVQQFRVVPLEDADGVYIEATLVNHLAPERKGVVRMPLGEGGWTVKKAENGTFVQLQMKSDPGGKIPDFLVNIGSVKAPYDTIMNLREYLEQKQQK